MRPVVWGAWWRMHGPTLAAGVCAGALPGCVAAPGLGGPLPVRNQHPAQLTVMHMDPASAAVLAPGDVAVRSDFAYTSLFLVSGTPATSWVMDGEILRADTRLGVGLGAGLEFGTQVAMLHTTGGFLDDFVIGYHDLFGLPDQDRDENPRDAFRVEARRDGEVAWSLDREGAALADLPMQLTWQLREPGPDRLGLAVRGGVELPTGDPDRGFGNGKFDASLGVLLDYRMLGVGWYGHVNHTFAGTPARARAAGLEFADVTSAGLAAEAPLGRDLHAYAQVEWESSTLRRLGPRGTARNQVLLWVGGRWLPAKGFGVEVAFGEDLQGLASPDFTAWLGFVWRPNG